MANSFSSQTLFPTYRIGEPFFENMKLGPRFDAPLPEKRFFKECQFLGSSLNTPLGVAAGPLLDSKWVKLYSDLGFDLLTYKTVRTREYTGYERLPNMYEIPFEHQLTPAMLEQKISVETELPETPTAPIERLCAANSFGIPSLSPDDWTKDMQKAKQVLKDGQILIASIVGTPDEDSGVQGLADDFALCAHLVVQNGAMMVEANFSCPNVTSEEGSVYTNPPVAGQIAAAIRQRIGDVPLLIKVGYFETKEIMKEVMEQLAPHIDGVTAINTISMAIETKDGQERFPERPTAGFGGWAIQDLGVRTVEMLCQVREEFGSAYRIIGVGGITEPSGVERYLNAGADVVEAGHAAVWNPYLAYQIGNSSYASV